MVLSWILTFYDYLKIFIDGLLTFDYEQVISDSIVLSIATSLTNLQELALCNCFGDMSISSFKFVSQNLRKLRLQRVTPWMTNDDLNILTQNSRNLVELSLSGCPLLNSGEDLLLVTSPFVGCGSVTCHKFLVQSGSVAQLFNMYVCLHYTCYQMLNI